MESKALSADVGAAFYHFITLFWWLSGRFSCCGVHREFDGLNLSKPLIWLYYYSLSWFWYRDLIDLVLHW